MGLFRLFWIPHDFGPARGAYVRYRADEMLAILALESHRAGAFIVGEDLGTVEHGMREQLAEHRVLCFRVMWFESQPPAAYPSLAMAATTTHDLPTVAGLWSGSDLVEQKALGFPADEAMHKLRGHLAQVSNSADGTPVDQVIEKTYQRLAEAPSLLLVATLEDALAVPERPNLPGTSSERKNWSLALPGGLEALESAELPGRIAQAMHSRERKPTGQPAVVSK
jgi:4-alpha-glucanotransferase